MDSNNWRPTPQVGGGGGEVPPMDTGDWRTQLQPDSRQRIVNKIMETLKRHLPFSGQEGLHELKKIAVRFEEKIYTAATSQSDYLRKISLKMLTMENKSQNAMPNSLPSNSAGNSTKAPDPASHGMHNQGPSLPIQLSANQPQASQQMLSQTIQSNIASAAVQGSTGLSPALPSVSGLTQAPNANVVGQNSNMLNISGVSQLMGQQQLQLVVQQPNATNMQQSQLIGQQNSVGAMQQQQQQQQRLLSQQDNLPNLQQHQQQQQQQHLMAQQTNLSSMHQQQLGPQTNVSGLQQQQLLGTQSGNSSMQTNQHSVHLIQQSKVPVQQPQQYASNLLPF